MTAQELLALVAQAASADNTSQTPVVETNPEPSEEFAALQAENARLKAISAFGITEEVYNEQSKYINFGAITPEQYNGMFGQAQPSIPEPQVDPVSQYATSQTPSAPALNENEPLDVAIAEALGRFNK